MPISSTRSQRSWSEADGCVNGRSLSQHSSNSLESSFEERCVDPVEERPQSRGAQSVHKAHPKDANSAETETIGFIPGSADSPPGAQTCGPCASPGSCRTCVCSILTCGLYRVCQRSSLVSCLTPSESSPDKPESVNLQVVNPDSNEARLIKESGGTDWPEDIHIHGVKVDIPRWEDPNVIITKQPMHGGPPGGGRRPSPLSFSWGYEYGSDSDEDVDSLIAKKLLDLYSEYQIEELAKCTSDSVFLKKSNEISQLISDLAEEHKLDEQDAECRLVRGIIRISTRKSKKKRPQCTRANRTLSDSGNETMRDSGSISFYDYSVQISKETTSDINARKMRRNSGEGYSSSSPTTCSPSHTEADSSGVSLLRTFIRT